MLKSTALDLRGGLVHLHAVFEMALEASASSTIITAIIRAAGSHRASTPGLLCISSCDPQNHSWHTIVILIL